MQKLHRAGFAVLSVRDEKPDSRDADENINDSFKLHREAQQHVHDIPTRHVTVNEHTKTNETPVNTTNGKENECNYMQNFHNDFIYI